MKRRLRLVQQYRARRRAGMLERQAAAYTAEQFSCSTRSVRRYDRTYRTRGKGALMPRYHVPPPASPRLGWPVVEAVLALRAHLGWCGQRIAAELRQRGMAEMSHTTVYRLLRRYHCRIRTYHPVGTRGGHARRHRLPLPARQGAQLDVACGLPRTTRRP